MLKVVAAATALLATLTIVGAASANNGADLYWLKTSDNGIVGVRATIGNPGSGQWSFNGSHPDFFGTSVNANNGRSSQSLFQSVAQGIFYDDGDAIDANGSCNDSSHWYQNFFYTETNYQNSYTCRFDGIANSTEAHVAKVERDSSNNWYGYLDGTKQGTLSLNWNDACGHTACGIQAVAENGQYAGSDQAGSWQGKFNGSDTPWQFENSCCWNTINNYQDNVGPNWTENLSPPSGHFPDGLWTLIYNK